MTTLRLTALTGLALGYWACFAQEGKERDHIIEVGYHSTTRFTKMVEVRYGPSPYFMLIAHGGQMKKQKNDGGEFFFPLGGLFSSSDKSSISMRGRRFGGGIRSKVNATKIIAFTFSASIDHARLRHTASASYDNFYLGLFPPYFNFESGSSYGESDQSHWFFTFNFSTQFTFDFFYIDICMGWDPEISKAESFYMHGTAGDARIEPLTTKNSGFIGVGLGFTF